MIPSKNNIKIEKNVEFKESFFGIQTKDNASIFNILRNKLYSDKILAVIREYSTNAYDAHVLSNKPNKPIEITLPTILNCEFKVRDYGYGLDEDDIRNIYTMYGASTKRTTNKAVGQLGLGSKAAFAYSDSFGIISIHNGFKKMYTAYIDETQQGKIALLNIEKTNESSGIEITIPVKKQDVNTFFAKAAKFFNYWNIKPIFKNTKMNFIENKPLLSSKTWDLYKYNYYSDSTAVMGNIAYNIDYVKLCLDNIQPALYELYTYLLKHFNLILKFKIGELDFSANREQLEYTEKTKKAIVKKLEEISKKFQFDLEEKINSCKTYVEATKFLYKNKIIFNYSNPYSKLFPKNYISKWHNKKIHTKFGTDLTQKQKIKIVKRILNNDSFSYVFNSFNHSYVDIDISSFFSGKNNHILFVLNDDNSYKKLIRTKYYIKNSLKYKEVKTIFVYFITELKKGGVEELKNKEGFNEILKTFDFVKLSSLPRKQSILCPITKKLSKNKIIKNKIFKLNTTKKYHVFKESERWIPLDIDLKEKSLVKKVYIPIYGYKWYLKNIENIEIIKLLEILSKYNMFNSVKYDLLYGIKEKHLNLIKDNNTWINFKDFLEEIKNKYEKEIRKIIIIKRLQNVCNQTINNNYKQFKVFTSCLIDEIENENNFLKYFYKKRKKLIAKKIDDNKYYAYINFVNLYNLIETDYKIIIKQEHILSKKISTKLIQKLKKYYPLAYTTFKYLNNSFNYYLDNETIKILSEYINTIDKQLFLEKEKK